MTHKANIGIALDGDADRVVLVCEQGRLIGRRPADGDHRRPVEARRPTGRRRPGRDVMSNLGLERYIGARGCRWSAPRSATVMCWSACAPTASNLGGEQSGHIIMNRPRHHRRRVDGRPAGAGGADQERQPASETFRAFEPVPQLLKNVKVGDANAALNAAAVIKAIAAAEKRLGKGGRILVRKSGTEPLIRVMAEGDDSDLVRTVVDQIIEAIPPPGSLRGPA